MTVRNELSKRHQRLEYVVCIEGVGWIPNLDPSNGFDSGSVVWTTADIDGTIASDLGITVYDGLRLRGTISQDLDARDVTLESGGMNLEIVDHDDWWLENFTPRKVETTQAVSEALPYYSTTVKIDNGSVYATGQEVWLGHRELVKLGTRALVSGTEYEFTGSTRGHKGTHRGSAIRDPEENTSFRWPVDTVTSTNGRFWLGRKVAVWMHVPGEATANLELLWAGRLANVVNQQAGNLYSLSCNGDYLDLLHTKKVQRDWRGVNFFFKNRVTDPDLAEVFGDSKTLLDNDTRRKWTMSQIQNENSPSEAARRYSMAAWYHYRWAQGGAEQMYTRWDGSSTSVQAVSKTVDGSSRNIIYAFMGLPESGQVFRGLWRSKSKFDIETEILPIYGPTGTSRLDITTVHQNQFVPYSIEYAEGIGEARVRFLLDSWFNDYETNRFQINKTVPTNPIDYALCFMLSTDGEYERFDAGASSTTTQVNWTGTGRATGLYVGKALFAVEDSNQFESRIITAQTSSAITVERAFSNTPASGQEYQVRNSVYDVLPMGWGLGINSSDIDIDSFLAVRDDHMPMAKVAPFVLGMEEELDIWELIVENIFRPYGILVYLDRTTGKITAKYLGDLIPDGTIEDYPQLSKDDITRVGSINYNFQQPIGKIEITARNKTSVPVVRTNGTRKRIFNSSGYLSASDSNQSVSVNGVEQGRMAASAMEDTTKIEVLAEQYKSILGKDRYATIEFSAIFGTYDTVNDLIVRANGLIKRYSIAAGVIDLDIDMRHYNDMQAGQTINITTLPHVSNHISGSRGLTNVLGRVISTAFNPSDPTTFNAMLELLGESPFGKIAPACELETSYHGTDGTGDYFIVDPSVYVADPDNDNDMHKFAVGDRIIVRDKNGAPYTGSAGTSTYTIASFGANAASTPQAASSNIVRVTGTIGSTGSLAAGDYFTFADWSNSNTSRMDEYAAHADTAGTLAPSDSGKVYYS